MKEENQYQNCVQVSWIRNWKIKEDLNSVANTETETTSDENKKDRTVNLELDSN